MALAFTYIVQRSYFHIRRRRKGLVHVDKLKTKTRMTNNSNSVSIKWRHLIVLSNLRPSGIWIKLKPGAVEPFLLINCIEGAPVLYVHVFRQPERSIHTERLCHGSP